MVGVAPRLGGELEELHRRHRLAGHGERGGEARSGRERRCCDRGGGQRRPEAGAVALRDRLVASPGCVEGVQTLGGGGCAHRRGGCRVERPLGEAEEIATRPDLLDVDADLAFAGERDQGQAARVAEVEAQGRGRVGERRLAPLAKAKLDSCWVLVQIEGQQPAQRRAGSCPIDLSAPDVHLLLQHIGEDT
jgi:hypothetical protein